MRKLLSLFAALLAVGCGSESAGTAGAGSGGGNPWGDGPVDSISLPALAAGTELAKVVVRKGYMGTQDVLDDEGNVIGQRDGYIQTWGYVVNVDPDLATSVAVPYGDGYTVEVIAGNAATGGKILAYYKSDFFSVPGNLAPALPSQTFAPTLGLPTDLYVGIPFPYDTYTVSVSGVTFPLSTLGSGWSVTAGGAAPISKSGYGAKFAAPTTADQVDFVATFRIDPSLLLQGEAATAWYYEATGSRIPHANGSVVIVP